MHSIVVHSRHPTVSFAAAELKKYLRLMSDTPCQVVEPRSVLKKGEPSIQIGLMSDFRIKGKTDHADPWDDEIFAQVTNGTGIIAGINPRSVLFAVYRFLQRNGVRYLRPGADGEWIPEKKLQSLSADFAESASRRYRGLCIEGAVSYEHVVGMIDWSAKIGYSAFFMQFKDGGAFFKKWYERAENPTRVAEPLTPELCRNFTIRIEEELQKRGMAYHAVGHGWTTEALGYPMSDWDVKELPLTERQREYLALVKGKRELMYGIPMLTSLCFSNSEVRELMVKAVVEHAEQHPEIDFLHFWLDDGAHNKCECPECAKQHVADFYVMMLNAIDAELTRRNLTTRIVFLAYAELLWPPKSAIRIQNPNRFVFMYAHSRSLYDCSLLEGRDEPLPPYPTKGVKLMRTPGEIRAFLKAWRDYFPNDAFHFEYYSTVAKLPLTPVVLARRVMQDVKEQIALRLDGTVSVEIMRNGLPVPLVTYSAGQLLWDANSSPERVISEYMEAAYGKDSNAVTRLLETIERSFNATYSLPGKMWERKPLIIMPSAGQHIQTMRSAIADLRVLLEPRLTGEDAVQGRFASSTLYYLEIMEQVAEVIESIAWEQPEKTASAWEKLLDFLQRTESDYAPLFDHSNFISTFRRMFIEGKVRMNPEDVVG